MTTPPWSEEAQREAKTFIYADGKYVEPGEHPVEMSQRIEHQTRWARRKAKTKANVGLVRALIRAIQQAFREQRQGDKRF